MTGETRGEATLTGELSLPHPAHTMPPMLRPKRTVPRFSWPLPPRNASLLTPHPRPPSLSVLSHNKPTQPQPDPDSRYAPKRFAYLRPVASL